ncbi:hypothetical protein C5167_041430 [Papaver somniferum]|nr:hypothetical protein C5167_041430 [Papaver somniferum]
MLVGLELRSKPFHENFLHFRISNPESEYLALVVELVYVELVYQLNEGVFLWINSSLIFRLLLLSKAVQRFLYFYAKGKA